MIVTAGHLADEVFEFKEKGKLTRFHVCYTHVSNDLTTKSFSAESVTAESFVSAPDFDAAIFRVSHERAMNAQPTTRIRHEIDTRANVSG